MIKKLWSWFVEAIKETLNLSWTLVGLVIATLTLTGSARQITGLATIITLGIWLVTIKVLEKEVTAVVVVAVVVHKRISYIDETGTHINICNCKFGDIGEITSC